LDQSRLPAMSQQQWHLGSPGANQVAAGLGMSVFTNSIAANVSEELGKDRGCLVLRFLPRLVGFSVSEAADWV